MKFLVQRHSRSSRKILNASIIWDFEIIPAPDVPNVKPVPLRETTAIDQELPPLNLDVKVTKKCLVNFDSYREESNDENDDILVDLLDEFRLESDEELVEECDRLLDEFQDSEDDTTDDENHTNYVQCFKIVGSHWEQRYQDSLEKCHELIINKENVIVRAEPEPNNIRDCNAIKFEVHHGGQWHIMGYCGVKEIPKLKRALHRQTIVSLNILNLKRT